MLHEFEKACLGNSGRSLYRKARGGVLQPFNGGGLPVFVLIEISFNLNN